MIAPTGLRPVSRIRGADLRERPRDSVRVSVVITNYGYARFLRGSVGSSLAQDGVEVEVIVVDDASPDDSAAVLARMAEDDPRVTVVLNPVNRRAVETFNTGLALATGDYVVRLDADDVLAPGALARAAALGEAFPSVGLIYGRPVHFFGDDPPAPRGRLSGWTVWSGPEWLGLRCRTGLNPISSPEAMVRRSVVDRVGGMLPELPHAHDMEWWLRIASASDVGHLDGVDHAWQRYHATSLSAREVNALADLRHRERVFSVLLDDASERNAELLGEARRALAAEAIECAVQAYADGRGGTAEAEGYLAFAREQGVSLDRLRGSGALAHAERLGARRAPRSPRLILRSVRTRIEARRAFARRQNAGL